MSGWSPAEMPDQRGRVAVVTGANSGLGFEVARKLTQAGGHVILACRDQTRGRDAVGRLRTVVPGASVRLVRLDLADLSSVRECAEEIAADHPHVDLLINNAGVMALPRRRTIDGFEMQFGTNHLGHFAFTGRLLPQLLVHPGSRVVTVTSFLMHVGHMRFDDLHGDKGRYHRWRAYSQSKLANLMFAVELQARLVASGVAADGRLISVAAHPGLAATQLQTTAPLMSGHRVSAQVVGVATRVLGQSAAAGALPILFAATAPGVLGGELYGPRFLEYRGSPQRTSGVARAYEPAAAQKLWAESEQETGVRFDALGATA
jgi:NAD(P)-dependent dehydrogenase (short-subunit alcohol dehydrogenase family)